MLLSTNVIGIDCDLVCLPSPRTFFERKYFFLNGRRTFWQGNMRESKQVLSDLDRSRFRKESIPSRFNELIKAIFQTDIFF